MGKKKKSIEYSRHHLLFQRIHFSRHPMASVLRDAFIFRIPHSTHIALHEQIHDVPLPATEDLPVIWRAYADNVQKLKYMTITETCRWLEELGANLSGDSEPFVVMIRAQRKFFEANL